MENVPSAEDGNAAVLLATKHQSTWETFAFPTIMPHPLAYVFKRELLYVPFFGWAMGRLDMIHIDRSRRTEAWNKVAEQGRRIMAQGGWVIMFPEGTRAPRGGQGVYKSGAARLAITTGTPIVPIAVSSAKCWPRKSFLLRPGLIDISIGPPIPVTGRQPDELTREVERWIEAEMRRLDPGAYDTGPTPTDRPAEPLGSGGG
jgi:1-acyl-sn-glycerol-3-phosphate acyltransferase